ncbi:Ferrous iron transporter FeoA domain-containing protein [Candidatus Magnetomoraceae bacterium gMMP-1]
MFISLLYAPYGKSLILKKIKNQNLASSLYRMGLFEGTELVRLDEEVMLQPIRFKGPEREAILGGKMATRVIVHLYDGRKLPLLEMKPGEIGHIEGLTCATELARTLEILGFKENDEITFIRKLPPMEYVAVLEKSKRVRLTEAMAAKIWGRMKEKMLQFCSAQRGEKFRVQELLCGKNAREMISSLGIKPGSILVLEGVEQAQSLFMNKHNPIIISGKDGLRLFLQQKQAQKIFVEVIS